MSHIFAIIFYIPLYNALILLINYMPGWDAGLAVVLLIVIVRLILFPLSKATIKTQVEMRLIEPELKKIKEGTKDKQEQSKKMMALYKEKGINPFAGIFLLLIQLPIIIALYQVFRSNLPIVDPTILYSFVHAPAAISMTFLTINLRSRSVILAILAVITQFVQINLALPKVERQKGSSFGNDLAYSMNVQMKYIFPLIIFPIAYFSAVIALYLVASNILMIFQEVFVRRRLERQYTAQHALKSGAAK
jgi:YidC/Oxa1 family membrane protein insertase